MVSSFNYFKMHAWSTSMLFLLHSAFMLSVVEMLRKRGRLEAVHKIIMKITLLIMEKSWNCVFEFLWNPDFNPFTTLLVGF